MKTVIRQLGKNESSEGASQLRVISYPDFAEVSNTGFYDNMYRWYGRHPLAEQLQRWISETEDGRVVGHLAAFPLYYRINGERIVAHTPGDYMVHPDHGFQALSLMRRFFKSVDNCFACDMVPAVISVERRFGAEVAGEMQYAAKLLNVSRLPVPPMPEPLRKALGLPSHFSPARGYSGHQEDGNLPGEDDEDREPAPLVRPRAPIPAPVKAGLNRTLEGLDRALLRGYGEGYEVEEVEHFDESFDHFFEKVATVMPCVPEKDATFLSWRYGPDSPQAPVKVLAIRGRQGLLGYAVIKLLSNGEDAFILDLTALPGYDGVARTLVRESVRYFRESGAHIIRYRYLESPTSLGDADLRRLGFFSRGASRRNCILLSFEEPEKHEMGLDLSNWSYNIGDGEATFWVR